MRPAPNLDWYERALLRLCKTQPPPTLEIIDGITCYRFKDRTIQAAILLKMARYVSGLHAGEVLLAHGFLQELGALQRSIQDFAEDTMFLSMACIFDDLTELHQQYLTAFWEEEPNFGDYQTSQKNRHETPRRKIQSYIATKTSGGVPHSNAIATSKYLSRIFSGFVHGAAPHLMELYDPVRRAFDVCGSSSIHLKESHQHDFENYLFRGVMVFALAAQALGELPLHEEAMALQRDLKRYYA